jgi:RecG-like helicase
MGSMKTKILVLVIVGFVSWQLTTFVLGNDGQVSIKGVVSNPVYYDGKKITVEGEVVKVHYTTSDGDPYTLFRLSDGEHNLIGVFYEGHLLISTGTKVRVTGEFKKEEQVTLIFTFKNVIEAERVDKI